jgi:hypothetical protein
LGLQGALLKHEIHIPTRHRKSTENVRIYRFADDMIALTVEGRAERSPTLLLSLDQAREMQKALADLIPGDEDEDIQQIEAA